MIDRYIRRDIERARETEKKERHRDWERLPERQGHGRELDDS